MRSWCRRYLPVSLGLPQRPCCGLYDSGNEPFKLLAREPRRRYAHQKSKQENGNLKWEVDSLRVELQDAEERAKGWLQVRIS